jgi:HK97 family phage portal protein
MNIGLKMFGRVFELNTKALPLQPLSGRGGWWPLSIREPYTGAWQRNEEIRMDTALSFSAVFACTTLIMSDTGKVRLRLVEESDEGIWEPVENPAFSPVLRKPNRWQTITQFKETWTASKLNSGNAYVLLQRDGRGVITAMYVLDPLRVTPMVTQDGAIYYELKRDDISGLPTEKITVPARDIIHDRMNCLFHPLVGLSPLFASAVAARQGLAIQNNSSKLFSNGSIPGGVLTAPGLISDEAAARLKEYWETEFTGDNVGRVAILGDGLKYEGMAWNAVDLQLIEQLRMSGENVCSAYRVPPYLVNIGPPPPYANAEPLIQMYFSQALQSHWTQFEESLDEAMGLGRRFGNRYGTEFDPDDLIWMDALAKGKAAADSIGILSPNEIRRRFYSAGKTTGGESPMVQQQYYSLAALAKRDAADPFAKPATPASVPGPEAEPEAEPEEDDEAMAASVSAVLHQKALAEGWLHAV